MLCYNLCHYSFETATFFLYKQYLLLYITYICFIFSLADGKANKKKRKKGEENETTEEGSDEEKPRKRGRPRGNKGSSKEVIKGFNDAEVVTNQLYQFTTIFVFFIYLTFWK